MGQQQAIVPGVQPSVLPGGAAPVAAAPAAVEWAIPQQKRVAYMSQFQVTWVRYVAKVICRFNLISILNLSQSSNACSIGKTARMSQKNSFFFLKI